MPPPNIDDIDPMVMILPAPAFLNSGWTAVAQRKVPVRLMSRIVCHSASEYVFRRLADVDAGIGDEDIDPAEAFADGADHAATDASSTTSTSTAMARAPSASSSATAAAFLSRSRPATAIAAPASARPFAIPRPIPPFPPVTSATRPARSNRLLMNSPRRSLDHPRRHHCAAGRMASISVRIRSASAGSSAPNAKAQWKSASGASVRTLPFAFSAA